MLARIRSLVIPPAWTDVWICPLANGHIQATGRDQRGRKQYIYHPQWRVVRDCAKFAHMVAFGSALPGIRRRVRRDLKLPGLPPEKVLAALVKLLEATLIRIGNDEYARANGSFGLTTFHNRHALVRGDSIRFCFRGKSGKRHEIEISDSRLARIVRKCQEVPGQELFEYRDESGAIHSMGSADVNAYLNETTGEHFTAKDFRTWAATCLASRLLGEEPPCASRARAERRIAAIVKAVAERLGNTASVCRKCYIHPAVIARFLSQPLADVGSSTDCPRTTKRHSRRAEEAALISLLRRQPK